MKTETIDRNWNGMLTAENIEVVVAAIRQRLEGKRFAIASTNYADSGNARCELLVDCQFYNHWSDKNKEMVAIRKHEDGRPWFGFSAGGSCWDWSVAPSQERDFRYPYFVFTEDSFMVKQMAPAGKDHLHIHIFKAQEGTVASVD